MIWLPEYSVIENEENKIQVRIRVKYEFEFFKGHFPGFAITPGIVLINWVYVLGQSFFRIQSIKGIPSIKFQKPILPGQTIFLRLDYFEQKEQLRFEYYDKKTTFSKGRMHVEGER